MKPPRSQQPYLPLLFILLLAQRVLSECYFPNGTLLADPAYQPCPGFDGTARMCCATNRTNPFGGADTNGWTANKCLPNGLCLDGATTIGQHGEAVLRQQYWRDLCTSQNWDDGGCLSACTVNANDKTIRMTPCGDPNTSTTWCCGDTMDCCNSSNAVYIAATLQGYISNTTLTTTFTTSGSITAISTADGNTTTTSTPPGGTTPTVSTTPDGTTSTTSTIPGGTTPTTSTSPTSTTSNQASSSLSTGLSTAAKTGIGIGVGAGAIVVLAGLAWILLKKRRAKVTPGGESSSFNADIYQSPKELPSNSTAPVHELNGDSVRL